MTISDYLCFRHQYQPHVVAFAQLTRAGHEMRPPLSSGPSLIAVFSPEWLEWSGHLAAETKLSRFEWRDRLSPEANFSGSE